MNLLQELRKAATDIPAIYSQDGLGWEAIARFKIFDPGGSWTWYVTEANAIISQLPYYENLEEHHRIQETPLQDVNWTLQYVENVLLFGLVDGNFVELGYFDLNELQAVRGAMGIGLEVDLHWTPIPLSQIAHFNGQR